eukprot:TRINITY_DN26706_c0_g1_i3.p1 TRINITY_DN26706_c0_g1~~TRINITY_DN26706_c0_g1_i3.p1  ORF type:complete len:760 (-),score=159.69 TRINITY_DN26706_c0_g1_i3:99-2378(-)
MGEGGDDDCSRSRPSGVSSMHGDEAHKEDGDHAPAARKTVKKPADAHADDHVKSTFVDAAAMKEKVRQNLSKPQYIVSDLYKDYGICQAVARSGMFDKATLIVISINTLWLAIDTDLNDATLLLEAHPAFVFAENFFCAFFTFEIYARYMAFKRKRDGFKDAWFVFDAFMVTMMIMETWVFTTLTVFMDSGKEEEDSGDSGGGANTSVLRVARLLRLSRMCRMARLLRAMPELMIMIKGMLAATRSVFFTLLLLSVFTYVFAIALKQLSEDTLVGPKYFPTVPMSMVTLVVYGVFVDSLATFFLELINYPHLATAFFIFVLIGSLTVLNMLVGVLCEVVSAVAATEQEEMLVMYVNDKLSRVMSLIDTDGGGSISKKEFMQILENVDAVRSLNDVGVDVFALVDLADYIFEDDDAANDADIELDFAKFMDVVLQLRGSNQATVKDIVDLRKFMRLAMLENYKQSTVLMEELQRLTNLQEKAFAHLPDMPDKVEHTKRLSVNPFEMPNYVGKKDRSSVISSREEVQEQPAAVVVMDSAPSLANLEEVKHSESLVVAPVVSSVDATYLVEAGATPILPQKSLVDASVALAVPQPHQPSGGLQNWTAHVNEQEEIFSDFIAAKGDWLPVDPSLDSSCWKMAVEDEITTAPPESRDAVSSTPASLADLPKRPLAKGTVLSSALADEEIIRGLGGLSSDRRAELLRQIQSDNTDLQVVVEYVDKLCKHLAVGLVEFLQAGMTTGRRDAVGVGGNTGTGPAHTTL